MIEVDPEQTLADIRDMVRKYQDDVPELQEVKISANKAELIEQVNEALSAYEDRITSLETQPELHLGPGEKTITGSVGSAPAESSEETSSEETPSEDTSSDTSSDASSEDTSSEQAGGLSPGQAAAEPVSPHPPEVI